MRCRAAKHEVDREVLKLLRIEPFHQSGIACMLHYVFQKRGSDFNPVTQVGTKNVHTPQKIGLAAATLLAKDVVTHLKLYRWQFNKLPPAEALDSTQQGD